MNLSSHYDEQKAKNYVKFKNERDVTSLLYRDIPDLIKPFLSAGKALDFGCGPGLSTRFLAQLGFDVMGVDINENMLKEAVSEPDGIPFARIQHGKIPFQDKSFDFVLAVLVLLEMPNLDEMRIALCEISRILRPGGFFLAVVGSEHFYKDIWGDENPVTNKQFYELKSGDPYYSFSKPTGITFKDYFYTEEDYRKVFAHADLSILQIHKALGNDQDNIDWKMEKLLNPWDHYLCQKI